MRRFEKWRQRRAERAPSEIDITAFMNLMVILIPFLLVMAVFSRVTILDLKLPVAASDNRESEKKFHLDVVVRKNRIDLLDHDRGFIRSVGNNASGYDLVALSKLLRELKSRFPQARDASILAEPEIAYDVLVQIIDQVRMVAAQGGAYVELFPQINLGDAPASSAGTP